MVLAFLKNHLNIGVISGGIVIISWGTRGGSFCVIVPSNAAEASTAKASHNIPNTGREGWTSKISLVFFWSLSSHSWPAHYLPALRLSAYFFMGSQLNVHFFRLIHSFLFQHSIFLRDTFCPYLFSAAAII